MGNMSAQNLEVRQRQVFATMLGKMAQLGDQMFGHLMIFQWIVSLAIALYMSPLSWAGRQSSLHPYVYAAFFLGGLFCGLPLLMIRRYPGRASNRYVIAVSQMLYSALLIHV